MPYRDPEERRKKQREARMRERARARAVSPFANVVRSHHQREVQQRKALRAAIVATAVAPITLPEIKGLTLEEIEEKYGRIE